MPSRAEALLPQGREALLPQGLGRAQDLSGAGRLLREHVRTRRGAHRIADADRPPRAPKTTIALLAAAHTAGRTIGQLCEPIHHRDGPAGIRRILGLLALARKYGTPLVEDAAQAALDVSVPTYRFVRRYLERRPPVTLRPIDPLIRPLTLYRNLIDRQTGGPA